MRKKNPRSADIALLTSLPPQLRQFLTLPQVLQVTGLSRAGLYRLLAADEFPKAVPLTTPMHGQGPTGRRVAWCALEIAEWQEAKIAQRDAGLASAQRRACTVCKSPLAAPERDAGVCSGCAPQAAVLPATTPRGSGAPPEER